MNCLKRIVPAIILAFVVFSTTTAAQDAFHVVGAGETIFSISRLYHVKSEDLMKANNITDASRLLTGSRLVIPSSSSNNSAPAAVSGTGQQKQQQNFTSYKVVKGDTLYSLAKSNGISLQTLLDINKFQSNHVIKAGDIIKLPVQDKATAQNMAKNPAPAANSSMRWPVNPRDISYMTGQMGVVVQGERLEPVKSLTQGKVISAGPWRKFDKVAIVEVSGGYYYVYGGCESLSVRVGDSIGPGTELGKLGINAVSDKPLLYFMVFKGSTPIDPAKAPRAGSYVKT
ncbi:MAG: LysM peptidoglycan-binding domain-containing protein [Treponema sp.]|nr:LysM peptidoglycan-binding domain-containing protein [Treponema sp.]